jgi:uncharacterized membrane protein YesL
MLGVCLGSLIGVVSLAASLDLHKAISLAFLFLPSLILFVSGSVCGILTVKMKNAGQRPGCTRVRDEIDSHFQ